MKRTPVDSSNLHSVGYEDGVLQIAFKEEKTGAVTGVYDYEGVLPGKVEALMASDSKGKYFHNNIKGKYAYKKVE
jgi:hypothetical protein